MKSVFVRLSFYSFWENWVLEIVIKLSYNFQRYILVILPNNPRKILPVPIRQLSLTSRFFFSGEVFPSVAEITSYFCLARKLIWPLGSTHIFTQRGWLILFIPDHFSGQHQIGENPPNTLFLRTFSKRTDVIIVRSLFSGSIRTPWGKTPNLWTSWVYSFRPRVPSWLWIRWIQSASHRNNFKSHSSLAMSTATKNSAQTSSHFIPEQHFLETFTLLSSSDQNHIFMDDNNFPVLNQKTRFLLHLWQPYLTHTLNNALTVTQPVSLKHLAAKIPS